MEWIKVSEGLPKDGGEYLTYFQAGGAREIHSFWPYPDRKKYGDDIKQNTFYTSDANGYDYTIPGVTHWTSLPPAPDEDGTA